MLAAATEVWMRAKVLCMTKQTCRPLTAVLGETGEEGGNYVSGVFFSRSSKVAQGERIEANGQSRAFHGGIGLMCCPWFLRFR